MAFGGGGGTFRADVSFVSIEPHAGVPWATAASVVARDAHNVAIPAKAGGTLGFVISDPAVFVREVVAPGDAPGATRAELAAMVASQFGEVFRTGAREGTDLLGPTGRLGLLSGERLAKSLGGMGVTLLRFVVGTVSAGPEVRRPGGPFNADTVEGYRAEAPAALFPTSPGAPTSSGLPALPAELADILEPPLPRHSGPKSARLPLADDAPEGIFAARQTVVGPNSERLPLGTAIEEHGGPGSGSMFDVPAGENGLRAADPSRFNQPLAAPAHEPAPPVRAQAHPPGPPPLPATLEFHVGIYGTPVGPFDLIVLAARVRDGSLGPKSLVWRPGFDGWTAAGLVPELAPLFAGPPELPPA
jgi:hypothetical protein